MTFAFANSKKQGDAGLGASINWFTKMGYTVCIPLTDSQDYDLVVDMGQGPKRVQVKTTSKRSKGKHFYVDLRTNGGNRSGSGKTKKLDPNSVDFLFVLTSDWDTYFIPITNVACSSALGLTQEYDIFKIKEKA